MNDDRRQSPPASQAAKTVAAATVPASLRRREQWVGWREEWRSHRATKVPRRCDRDTLAAVNDPASWSAFEAAVEAYERGLVDGIGFVFTPDDPFTGVDLDDCVDATGRLHPAAERIIQTLDSYSELSPSGKGVHAIVEGVLGDSRHRTSATGWGGQVEVYDRARYFTVTGCRLPDVSATIEPRQVELDALVARLLSPRETRPRRSRRLTATPSATFVDLADEELLRRARRAKNGRNFVRLYDLGDCAGYDSQSEADLRLCGILAFWTGGDVGRIDRLFRSGSLFREKWDETGHDAAGRTYGALTIEVAVGGCRTFYVSREQRLRTILGASIEPEMNRASRKGLA